MKIFISGGTGFVGRHLTRRLLAGGHEVVVSGTRPPAAGFAHHALKFIQADTTRSGPWQELLPQMDAVINLAGRSISRRWTARYKQQMFDSRILTTRHIVEALPDQTETLLCSTSAVGYYGDRQEQVLTEAAPPAADFLGSLSQDWEAAALAAEIKGARVAVMRFGVVLEPDGGALAQMLPLFRLGLGGPLGNGRQWMAWIHLLDLLAAIEFILNNAACRGVFNFCAPEPVRNRELAQTLGRCLKRPAILPAPALMLRLVLGEFAGVLLASQRAVPEHLLQAGFTFGFPTLREALQDLV